MVDKFDDAGNERARRIICLGTRDKACTMQAAARVIGCKHTVQVSFDPRRGMTLTKMEITVIIP